MTTKPQKTTEISHLSILDRMIKDDNHGIRLSTTLCKVEKVSQGTILGFGVENTLYDDATLQLLTKTSGENMLLCLAVSRNEFEKTKQDIISESERISTEEMYDRFDQCNCAQVDKIFWMLVQYENSELKDMLCDMEKDDFKKLFPGVITSRYSENIQNDRDEIIATLYDKGYSGLVAEVHYPQMQDFEFKEDGSVRSCSFNGNYYQIGYVYAETKEELLEKIELQSEEMEKYWIEMHNSESK